MERSQRQRSWVGLLLGGMLAFWISSIIFGNLEPIMTEFKAGKTTAFNETLDDVVSYGWSGMQLATLGLLILGGSYILKQVNFIGGG